MALFLVSCYEPSQFESTGPDDSHSQSSVGIVSPINTGKQICNPAISMDTAHFPGAMLWLGFSGNLVVKDPPAGYTVSGALQHDRLTISNFDNSVAWFLMKDEIPAVTCEFQDPDWSAHPDWIVTMGARAENGDCGNDAYIYSGWVIRPYDQARFRFSYEGLDYISTPHAWFSPAVQIPETGLALDSVTYDKNGLATPASVRSFFGTDQAVFTWSKEENGYTVHFIDYSESAPQDRKLRKPAGRENWKAESAMISPDGKFVTYNLYDRPDSYSVYIQELREGSQPVLVSEGAMDPRWWVHPSDPNRLFLVYMQLPSGTPYVNKSDLLDSELLESGSAGSTWMRELRLFEGLPQALSVEWVSEPKLLVNLPFRAGLSPDGHYLATGTNNGYMMELF